MLKRYAMLALVALTALGCGPTRIERETERLALGAENQALKAELATLRVALGPVGLVCIGEGACAELTTEDNHVQLGPGGDAIRWEYAPGRKWDPARVWVGWTDGSGGVWVYRDAKLIEEE